jgi:5-methylcytosine-specific restriction endonuclease McrA
VSAPGTLVDDPRAQAEIDLRWQEILEANSATAGAAIQCLTVPRWLVKRWRERWPEPARERRPGAISTRTRALVFERDEFRCRRCGAGPDDGARLVVDHVVPVARGGTGELANLQTLCEPCNQGKQDRPPHAHDLRPAGDAHGGGGS